MTYKTYYLSFNSPLHLGNHKPESYEQSEEFLRSDTIVAAIFATWAKMGHEDWIPEDGNPPFTLSSAFPYVKKGEGDYIHFFPRPKVRFNKKESEHDDSTVRKKIKKVQWLDQHYFEAVINYRSLESFGVGNRHLKGNFLCKNDVDMDAHITRDLLQRVTISRNIKEPKDSEPFYMERIFFDRAGLYFMVEGEEMGKLETALEFLQYEGFGTDRTVGNGFFDLERGSIQLNVPTGTETTTNLSLYIPKNKEEFLSQTTHEDAAFEGIKRGGWITTAGYQGKEKKSLMMFSEGGIWKQASQIAGRGNIDLRPSTIEIDHPLWRSGKSIFVPIKTN